MGNDFLKSAEFVQFFDAVSDADTMFAICNTKDKIGKVIFGDDVTLMYLFVNLFIADARSFEISINSLLNFMNWAYEDVKDENELNNRMYIRYVIEKSVRIINCHLKKLKNEK